MTSTETFNFNKIKADVAEKVRKLLNQAENPGATLEEAEAFSAKAQQLMSRYAITLAMVQDSHKTGTLVDETVLVFGLWASRKTVLLGVVARANDVETVRWKSGSGIYLVSLVGFDTDIDWVKTLYTSLEVQMQVALDRSIRIEKPTRIHGRAWGAAFVSGFTSVIHNRLREARREAVRAAEAERVAAGALEAGEEAPVQLSSSVALVLVAKSEKVQKEFKIRHPHVRTTQAAALSSSDGHRSGREAGSKASLARGSVGGGSKGSLGR